MTEELKKIKQEGQKIEEKNQGENLKQIPNTFNKNLGFLDGKAPVVFISSYLFDGTRNSSAFEFFTEIFINLTKQLDLRYIDLIVKIPSSSGDPQHKLFERVLENKHKYSAVIISPSKIDSIKRVLLESKDIENKEPEVDVNLKIPIITIDKHINQRSRFRFKIPYSTADWKQGGKIAGEFLVNLFKEKDKNYFFYILKGAEGSKDRINGFIQAIKEINMAENHIKCSLDQKCDDSCKEKEKKCRYRYEISDNLFFSRFKAKSHILSIYSTKGQYIDAIFSCNDDMALGARDGLMNIGYRTGAVKDIKIVGFDGTNIAKQIIKDKGERFLVGTVDVGIENQVDAIIQNLSNVFQHNFFYSKITCKMYP